MRTIERTGEFKRDYKRESKGKYRKILVEELTKTLTLLAGDEEIPARMKDHALVGNWSSFRDCHIKPDLVLIYKKTENNSLILVRLGSHSELGL